MAKIKLDDTTDLDADLGGNSIPNGRVIYGRLGVSKDFGNKLRGSAGVTGEHVKVKDYNNTEITGGDVSLEKEFEKGSKLRGKYHDSPEEKKIGLEYEIPFKKGGKVSKASKRADGCAQRGKTRGRLV